MKSFKIKKFKVLISLVVLRENTKSNTACYNPILSHPAIDSFEGNHPESMSSKPLTACFKLKRQMDRVSKPQTTGCTAPGIGLVV